MSATIWRLDGNERLKVAYFTESDDALRCFKSMAYALGERLIMVADGPVTVNQPTGCHLQGTGEYVLNPVFGEDRLEHSTRRWY